MAEARTAAPGTPIWIDVATPDIGRARQFYTQLFGWEAQDQGPDAGGYVVFTKDGKAVAAAAPAEEGHHPAWALYFHTPDAAATAQAVGAAGGTVVMPPFDVLGLGRMGVFQDRQGAFFSIWEPKTMLGFEIRDVPGAFKWADLTVPGTEEATDFYSQVFGWRAERQEMPKGEYTFWKASGNEVGGIMDSRTFDVEVPPHWLIWFATDDVEAGAARARELGGKVEMEPMDFGGGWTTILSDPTGAVFGLLKTRS